MNSTDYPMAVAYECANTATRVTMDQLADGVDIGTRFYQSRTVIDAAWTLYDPLSTDYKDAVFNNLDIRAETIVIEGEDFEVYTAPQKWCDQIRFARAAGQISFGMPICERARFLTLPET